MTTLGSGLLTPSPLGPRQHRFARRPGHQQQPVEQPAHFGNRITRRNDEQEHGGRYLTKDLIFGYMSALEAEDTETVLALPGF